MKLINSSSIERGFLPLLDISIMLFGIMIIVLTFSKFTEFVDDSQNEEIQEESTVVEALSESILEISTTEEIQEMEIDSESESEIIKELVKEAISQEKIILLRFSIDGILYYNDKEIFNYRDGFNELVLNELVEIIEENNPIIIVGYPETKGYNRVTRGVINVFKNRINEITNLIFFMGLKINEN